MLDSYIRQIYWQHRLAVAAVSIFIRPGQVADDKHVLHTLSLMNLFVGTSNPDNLGHKVRPENKS